MLQDEVKYRQIITNLVGNALHHRRQWMDMRVAVKGDRLHLEILDDGPGIAPKYQQVIFQRYAQVQDNSDLARKGHGLGLAGARILARCLGGDIRIESEIDQGANFIVELPLQFPEENQ
jgi:signal transduction histidine kinase